LRWLRSRRRDPRTTWGEGASASLFSCGEVCGPGRAVENKARVDPEASAGKILDFGYDASPQVAKVADLTTPPLLRRLA